MIDPQDVARRLDVLRNRLADLGGDDVTVLAVTKGFGVDAVAAAVAVGLPAVGENYAQELAEKAESDVAQSLVPTPEWHFIGQMQSRRVRLVAPHVALWQSVDRAKVGARIANHAPGARVMVQVNATGEPQKAGCEPTEVTSLVDALRQLGLEVVGLMTVGRVGDRSETLGAFQMVRDLADTLELPQRSMGMTADLDLAIEAGSTMIRVGTGLFGPRPPRNTESG